MAARRLWLLLGTLACCAIAVPAPRLCAQVAPSVLRGMSYVKTLDELVVATRFRHAEAVLAGGYHLEGDGGGGWFVLRPAASHPGGPDGGTVFGSAHAGRYWVRVLEGAGRDVNLRWFGVGYGDGDPAHYLASAELMTALQLAADQGGTVLIPAGTYQLKDVNPPGGSRIRADSGALVSGVTTGDTLFRTQGLTSSFAIEGGRWQYCQTVWEHTIGATQALIQSRFENMTIGPSVGTGFWMEASVGNRWQNVRFAGIGQGIVFAGPAQSNVNIIEGCQFLEFSGDAIEFAGATAHSNNVVRDCWFESSTVSSGAALFVHSSIRSLSVESCYFEEIGDAVGPAYDIELAPIPGQAHHSVVVRECHFGPHPGSPPPARILVNGLTSLTARDNGVWLHESSGQVFVRVIGGPGTPYDVDLHKNDLLLSASTQDRYAERLFTSNGQVVNYTSNGASGNVQGQENGVVWRGGTPVAVPLRLPRTTDGTDIGTVETNAVLRVDGDVKFLEGGRDGQIVHLVCDVPWPTPVTLYHRGAIPSGSPVGPDHLLLSDGLDFVVQEGFTLTLLRVTLPSHGAVWVELGRSVRPAP